MDFDFTTETITPDSTSILTIGGTGALELPVGTTGQEPSGAIAGAIRYNSSVPQLEYYNGSGWVSFSGSVTSVNLTAGSGVSVSGGPITTSGSITVTNTGVLSISGGTTGLTPSTATTGVVTLGGTLNLASGGTNANLSATAGAIVYSGASALALSAAGTSGQVLISGGTGAPTWTSSPTISGANITATTIPNSALVNSTITVTGGTGLGVSGSPVALGGTVTLSNTGVTSAVAGTGVTVSSATGAVTIGVANIPNTALQNSSVTIGTTTVALGGSSTTLGGLTGITLVSGTVTGVASPVNASDVVPLSYLQSVIAGLEWKNEAVAATTADLGSVTYANGASGVGATITNAGTQAAFTIDGYSPALNSRVLVKNETNQAYNGIYTVTTVGSGSTNWVLTRATDANSSSTLNNATLFITNGTANANTAWTQTTANPTVGTSNVVFVQSAGSGTYTAGTGLTLTGNTFSITNVGTAGTYGDATHVPVFTTNAQGQVTGVASTAITFPVTSVSGSGAGISVTPTTGAVVVSNTGVTSNVAGTGISVSGGTGAVTISNTGVLSFSGGTTGLTPATTTTGAITLAGTLVVGNGGTGVTSLTTNGVLYGGSTVGATAAGTTGQVLVGNTSAAPSWSTLSSIAVTSINFGTTGLTPATSSTGAVTVAGTLAVANGGTGLSSTPSNGQIDIGNGSGFTRAALTAGTAISITNGAGSITINNTGVTSAVAGTGISVSGATGAVTFTNTGVTSFTSSSGLSTNTSATGAVSVTNTGVLSVSLNDNSTTSIYTTSPTTATTGAVAATITLKSQTANTVFAAPNGSAGQPSFRALAYADLPLKLYVENPSTPTAPSATGTNAVAIGSGTVAAGTSSTAMGLQSDARLYGQQAAAAGEFTAAGDAQNSTYMLRIITTNATPAIAFLDGSSARLTLPINSAFMFDADIVARRTDATGTFGAWNIKGLITQDATAATTALQGSARTFIAGSGLSIASVSATADTTNGALQFNVTGVAAETIRWVITCRTTEVQNA
jgi:hypothetical protein